MENWDQLGHIGCAGQRLGHAEGDIKELCLDVSKRSQDEGGGARWTEGALLNP